MVHPEYNGLRNSDKKARLHKVDPSVKK